MLQKLYIKNYALIDTLEIRFDQGLNILTGETGAGKSIILGALGLILGNRVEGRVFFDEQSKCIIEGHFDIKGYDINYFFVENDLEFEQETIIRREITPEGKSRAFINDTPVNLQILKQLGEKLIDIHSQHATLQINTQVFQLLVLDSVAKNSALLGEYERTLKQYRNTKSDLDSLEEEISKANAELDYHQFVANELEVANLHAEEVYALESEQQQLEHAEEIKRSLNASNQWLDASEYNVLRVLKDAVQEIQRSTKYLPQVEELATRLNSSYIEIKDVSDEMMTIAEGIVMNEERLQYVQERLSLIYSLVQKYRVSDVADLLVFKRQIEEKITTSGQQEEKLEELKRIITTLESELLTIGKSLSARRKEAIPTVEGFVQDVLAKVGISNAVLKIALEESEIFGSHGLDKVEFLFSANKGQPLQSIHKVASGGELSRIMLAIKSLVAKSSALPTIIFDEIDTGVSGEVALRVGEIMESLGGHMQVIAITHLPQIASRGYTHFKVYKEEIDDRTLSRIGLLDEEERVLEIAKMLSGSSPGDTAIQHAKELVARN